MISLDKCTGSCNVLSPKICLPKETDMITNKKGIQNNDRTCFKWLQM